MAEVLPPDIFGTLRLPSRIDSWENRKPASLAILNESLGQSLLNWAASVNNRLLWISATNTNFIWVMDQEGVVHIAVEELAELEDGTKVIGIPRRAKLSHKSQDKKLGHPTLIEGRAARIAGQLFLDGPESGPLNWYIDDNSGRYCRELKPSTENKSSVLSLFRSYIGGNVIFDDGYWTPT
jgi:adenylate cyclase